VWSIRVITKCLTQFLDCCVQAVIKINERVGGPEALPEFLAGHEFTGMLEQHFENPNRLTVQFQPDTIPAHLLSSGIELEGPEA
jgi:hypothetical protein